MAKRQVAESKPPSLSELIKRTDMENPKPADLAMMKIKLDDASSFMEANTAVNHAFSQVVDSLTSSALLREVYARNRSKSRCQMDYESESAMVRMLIDNVIICQIRMSAFEAFHVEKIHTAMSIKEAIYWDKLLSSYHRRFIKACEALAAVKRVLWEAELLAERAGSKRGESSLQSAKLYKVSSE